MYSASAASKAGQLRQAARCRDAHRAHRVAQQRHECIQPLRGRHRIEAVGRRRAHFRIGIACGLDPLGDADAAIAAQLGQRRRSHHARLRHVDSEPGQGLETLRLARARGGEGLAEMGFLAALGPVPASHLVGRP
jgi:hypothetical protein